MRSSCTVLALLLVALAASAPVEAASFDCAKAEKPDEMAVCDTPELSEFDTQMGALWFTYSRIPFAMGGSGARRDDAEAFLQQRAACGEDVACLRQAYRERIQALEEGIAGWLQADAQMQDGPPWSEATMPGAVVALMQDYVEQCSGLGGTLEEGFDRPLVMTADLDGDGIQDFVLNSQNMRCNAAATAYCGNGGCRITLALSSVGYGDPVEILGGTPAISQSAEHGTVLDVWVHGSNCDGADAEKACFARYSWKNGQIDTIYSLRPQPE